ncbi:chemotaxis protein CheW [Rhodohalobacter sp. 8-1]|uniref:chemotaxis protein CheW n=1 Tax=Rhodohalobacter sp. 8-1 TaxID=3131972 RepID=UPI0030ED39A4
MENTEEKDVAVEELVHTVEGGKFLSFFLGKEEYAIEILKVQEIIGLMPITPVPRMPGYIKGVLNLRGKIVPVMNLRSRFGLKEIEYTEETCIIVVQENQYLMGVIVDKVSEVADIDGDQIEEVPSLGAGEQSDYLSGIGKVKEQVKMIVDVERVLFDVPDDVLDGSTKAAGAVA